MAERVRDIMETKLVTISANERLSTVDDIMTLGRVRHIPVVLAGRLVGVVSQRDLLRASLSALSEHRDAERRAFLFVDIPVRAPRDRQRNVCRERDRWTEQLFGHQRHPRIGWHVHVHGR